MLACYEFTINSHGFTGSNTKVKFIGPASTVPFQFPIKHSLLQLTFCSPLLLAADILVETNRMNDLSF
jgi:hypothetical protein